MTIRVETLGGFRVLSGDAELTRLPRRRVPCALLTFLAIERFGHRERLVDLLWPDHDPDGARHVLSQTLYALKQSLGPDLIEVHTEPVAAGELLTSDAIEFEDMMSANDLAQACLLYRGPFLQSVRLAGTAGFEQWVEQRRSKLAMLYGTAQDRHVRELGSSDPVRALAAARRWVLAEPLDDRAQHCLVDLLARSGMRNEALRQYADFRDRLRAVEREPLESLRELARVVEAGSITVTIPEREGDRVKDHLAADTGIVVLPIVNLCQDRVQDYVCEGLVDDIIHALGRVAGLRVVPRTSSFSIAREHNSVQQIMRELGVTHALKGTIAEGERQYPYTVNVTLHVDSANEVPWTKSFHGALDALHVLTLKNQICREVLEALSVGFRPTRSGTMSRPHFVRSLRRSDTTDPEAHALYLRGRHAWYTRSVANLYGAIELFQMATRRDPAYSRAWAGIADAYNVLGGVDYATEPPKELYPKALGAALRAIECDEDSAEAYAALANYQMSYEWKWADAEQSFLRAIEINPGYSSARQWYSNYLMYRGREDEAVEQATLAMELDPRSVFLSSSLARHYQLMRQYERAVEQYTRALELDRTFVSGIMGLALAELQAGRPEVCLGKIDAMLAMADRPIPFLEAIRAYTLARLGDEAEARRGLQRLKATAAPYLPPEYVALVYLGLEETNRALDWFEQALEARSQTLSQLNVEPLVDPLRSHPRFKKILAVVGF